MAAKLLVHIIVIAILLVMPGCGRPANVPAEPDTTLIVSAAASLTVGLQQLQTQFAFVEPSIRLRFNFGSSGSLASQIEQGAPADLFLSADEASMQQLVDNELIRPDDRTMWLSNALTVIAPRDSAITISSLADLTDANIGTVAIGDPRTVPAGAYAQEALIHDSLSDRLHDKLIYAGNVRQALALVETGNADCGIVYRTDALSSDNVRNVFTIDAAYHRPILYEVGIVRTSSHREASVAFYRYLLGDEAKRVMRRYGFGTEVRP